MNRTLLLILCDFLLLTLLALTRWETAEPERPVVSAAADLDTAEEATAVADDVVELMRLSFEEQSAAQAAAQAQLEAEIAEREQALEQSRQAAAQEIADREEQLAALDQERATLQDQRRLLARSLANTREQASELSAQLETTAAEAQASRDRLDQLQRDLEQREAEAAEREQELAQLAQAQAEAQAQIENLNVAVQVAEQEKVLLRETAETFRQQAEIEREERLRVQETTIQLAEGVGELAEQSAEISAEIRENRPINANTLFSEFLLNRVPTTFEIERPGIFNNTVDRVDRTRTILVSDGTTTYAVLHLEATPFNFLEPPSDWNRIDVQLQREGARAQPTSMRFLARDPRVVALPLSEADVAALGVKVYEMATDPFRFPDAVLINNGGQGYGEVPFKLEADLPGYVRMDNSLVRRLMGDFPPSQGDLVLSRTGRLLGIMTTDELCVLLDDFTAEAEFQTGDTSSQSEAAILNRLRQRFQRPPNEGPRGSR